MEGIKFVTDVGFSVVGLGMGKGRAGQVVQTNGARLVSVVDLNESLAKEVGGKHGCKWTTDLDDALHDGDVDVVFVVTPSGLHGEIAVRALEAGKHAISTKPMEVTPERCDTMIEAQQKTGKLLGIDFQERYLESNQFVKFAMTEGLLGKPVLGEARLKWYRSQPYYDKGGWRGTWKMDGGGSLANQSIHWIDLLQWIMGDANRVWAKTGTFTHQIETEDIGSAMIEFKSGAMGGILGTTTFPGDPFAGLEIHGAEGGFISTRTEPEWYFLEGMEDRKQKLERLTPANNIVEDFVSAVRDGTPLLCDGEEGRKSIALLAAVYQSGLQDGAAVTLR